MQTSAISDINTVNLLYGDILPTPAQGEIISAKWSDINTAIESFGGTKLSSSFCTSDTYYGSDKYNYHYYYYCIAGSGGSLSKSGNTPYVRGVTNLISDSTNNQ